MPGFGSASPTLSPSTSTTGEGSAVTHIIWSNWNESYTSATLTLVTSGGCGGGTATISSATTWTSWNQTHAVTTLPSPSVTIEGTGGTSAITTGDTWIVWNNQYQRLGPTLQLTNEQYQAQQRRYEAGRAEREAAYRVEEGERRQAKVRAEIILRENLSDEQKVELSEKKYFTIGVVDGKSGERRTYRIHQGRSRNVEQVDAQGRRIKRLCIHPNIDCPDEDTMLAQKLLLETEEDRFLRIANHS